MAIESAEVQDYAGLLSRIALAGPDQPTGAFVDRALRELTVTEQLDEARVRSVWDELVGACVDDAISGAPRSAQAAQPLGAWFADDGRPLTDTLQVIHELRHTAMESLRLQALEEGRDEPFVIAGITRIATSMNNFMLGFSHGYFQAEVANRARRRTTQDTFVWSVLSGTTRDGDAFNRLGAYGLDGSASYRAFRAAPQTDAEHAELEAYLRLAGHESDRRGVSTSIDGDVCGFVESLPDEPAPMLIGVSEAVAFAELPAAFRRATRAFQVAKLAGAQDTQSLEDLGIITSVMTDQDVADVLTRTYLDPLHRLGDYGESLLHTIWCYIGSDCQVDVTARTLALHVNTVRYRITKFEEILGISLRDTHTLAEVWWALRLPDELSAGMPPGAHASA